MKRLIYRAGIALALVGTTLSACTDLDLAPLDTATPNVLFTDADSYRAFIARVYAGLAVTGQSGPTGAADISSIDEGFSSYMRQYWQLQQLTTDETIIAWGDDGLQPLVFQTYDANNPFVRAMYYRVYYQVSLANEFLRESTADRLDARGIENSRRGEIETYRSEARFLRALSLYHALDFFGTGPLYTEEQVVGGEAPGQATGQEIFDFVESELRAIIGDLPAAGSAETGRVDQAAAQMLLSRLYLNADVYVGQERYNDALTAAKAVIDAGVYTLEDDYRQLFGAENATSPEVIWSILFDGDNTQTFGGTTYLVHAALGGSIDPETFGVNAGWGGLRARPQFVNQFADISGDTDERAIFFTEGQNREIESVSTFTDGYAVPKWTNLLRDGTPAKDLTFPDTDFPVFRLAEAHLNYAEAVAWGATNGDRATAVQYVNALRERAYDNAAGNITDATLTTDFLLDERSRELYWEGHRRVDLRRHGKYTGDEYIWAWKGGTRDGQGTPAFREVYPIPASELIANPKLSPTPGY